MLNSYSFGVHGLDITYTEKGQTFEHYFDPKATSQLLKNLPIIEDFDIDQNGEPVILYSEYNLCRGYGFELWCLFVKTYPFRTRHFELIAEHLYIRQLFETSQRTIDALLAPIEAVA